MANLFSKAYSKLDQAGLLSSMKASLATYTDGQTARQLGELATLIKERLQSMDQLLTLFSGVPELMDDVEIDTPDVYIDIDTDTASDLVDTLNSLYNQGITLTDQTGSAYRLAIDTQNHVVNCVDQNATVLSTLVETNPKPIIRPYLSRLNSLGETVRTSVAGVIAALVENNQIYEFLHSVTTAFTGSLGNPLNMISSLASWGSSKFASVRNMYHDVFTSYSGGGISGVVQYLYDFLMGASSVEVADDGSLQFTDNAKLVPEVFLSGILQGVIASAGLIATTVATIIAPMAGAVAGAVSTLGMKLLDLIFNANAASHARVNTSSKVFGEMAPIAFAQQSIRVSGGAPLDEYFDRIGSALILDVPGGNLFITRVPSNSNLFKYTAEFHPSVLYSSTTASFLAELVSHMSEETVPYGGYSLHQWRMSGLYSYRTKIEEFWAEVEASTTFINGDDNYLSQQADEQLRHAINLNTALYFLWIRACYNATTSNQVALEIAYANNNMVNPITVPAAYKNAPAFIPANILADAMIINSGVVYASYGDWTQLAKMAKDCASITTSSQHVVWPVIGAVMGGRFYGVPSLMPTAFDYCIEMPKYTAGSVYFALAITAISAAVAVTTTVLATKFVSKRRAIKAAKVNKAYEAFANNPNSTTYKAYRKAVKSNNRYVSVFGGTKYSTTDYWFGESESSSSLSAGLIDAWKTAPMDAQDLLYQVITGKTIQ